MNHGLVADRQQLLADGQRRRIETGGGSPARMMPLRWCIEHLQREQRTIKTRVTSFTFAQTGKPACHQHLPGGNGNAEGGGEPSAIEPGVERSAGRLGPVCRWNGFYRNGLHQQTKPTTFSTRADAKPCQLVSPAGQR